jgi:beta-N-acetylhexosaminidase
MADGALFLLGVSGPELTPAEAALFRRLQPAGYLLAGHNFSSPAQTRKLTDDLRDLTTDTPVIAIEQQGGNASPLSRIASATPSPSALASRGDLGKIADAGVFTGDLLRLLGINLNIAPVLDLEAPDDRQTQFWGSDPQRIIDRAGQWNRWMRKRSIAGCAGNFPGSASASNINDLLRRDIIPYTALMPELDAVMTGHRVFPNIDPEFPAALSQRIVRSFLRDQLGFDKHLVLTETREVGSAIRAGNDLVILRHPADGAEAACAEIAGLPHWIRDDARIRLERFRKKKLHGPLKWSEETWLKTRTSMETLSAEFPEVPLGS